MERYIATEYGHVYYDVDSYEIPLVYRLYVDPEFRRQGKARLLLSIVTDVIRKLGFTCSIMIHAEPFGDCQMSKEQLEDFYLSAGLIVVQPHDD